MKSFNNRFGSDPPGEPAWMREFARGGDPTVHRQDESWPAAGVVAYNARQRKGVHPNLPSQSGVVGKGGIRRGLTRGGGTPIAHRGSLKAGKAGGGCSCGGDGKCKSERGGIRSQGSNALAPSRMLSPKASCTASAFPTVAELVAQFQKVLNANGIKKSDAEATEIVRKALSETLLHKRQTGRPPLSAPKGTWANPGTGRRQP